MLSNIKFSIRFNFLQYVLDSFEEKNEELKQDYYAKEEDQDESSAEKTVWVTKETIRLSDIDRKVKMS
nr:hypothetical protein [Staphylococcus sp. GDY8P45P]